MIRATPATPYPYRDHEGTKRTKVHEEDQVFFAFFV